MRRWLPKNSRSRHPQPPRVRGGMGSYLNPFRLRTVSSRPAMSPSISLPRFVRPALLLICWLAGLGMAGAQFEPGTSKQVTPSLVADTVAITPGKPFTAGIRLKMLPGWHVYTEYPGDSGAPPTVEWDLP